MSPQEPRGSLLVVGFDDLDVLLGKAGEGEDAASLARYALTHAAQLPGLIKTGMRSARAANAP